MGEEKVLNKRGTFFVHRDKMFDNRNTIQFHYSNESIEILKEFYMENEMTPLDVVYLEPLDKYYVLDGNHRLFIGLEIGKEKFPCRKAKDWKIRETLGFMVIYLQKVNNYFRENNIILP